MTDVTPKDEDSNMPLPVGDVTGNQQEKNATADLLKDIQLAKGIFEPSQNKIHYFMTQSFKHGLIDREQAISILAKIFTSAENTIDRTARAETRPPGRQIPKIIHRVWLSKPSSPVEPPARYISSMIQDSNEYESHGWSCLFWLQDFDKFPNIVDRIKTEAPSIKIMRIEDALPSDGWEPLYRSFLNDSKFPFAADIVRMRILYEFGGIYADMGARLRNVEIAEAITAYYDYAFIFWETMFFQNSLMAMPPKNRIADIFLRICRDPYIVPKDMIAPLSGITEGMAFSGLMITSILLNIHSDEMLICPLPANERCVQWSSEQSWYTDTGSDKGKYGNTFVPKSAASFFELEKFDTHEDDEEKYADLFK